MFLLNHKGERCEAEICVRHNDTPVLSVGEVRIYPSDIKYKYWEILYASDVERQALTDGGYKIPNVSMQPLRRIA